MFLVTGATGGLGRRIVRSLRDQGQSVRAFVRLNSRYSELESRGAEIFIGDLLREKDLEKACRDVQFIISTHGSSEAEGGTALEIDYRANIELIDQAKVSGVQHLVFVSVLGADRGYEDAPVFKAKRAVELYLQGSELNYTILRPSGFASNLLPLAEQFRQTGVYLLVGDPKIRTSIVSTDDLAQIAIACPTTPAARNQVFAVGGPEVLERGEIVQMFSRIFNREPFFLNLPLLAVDGVRTAVGLFNPDLKSALGTFRTLLSNEFYCTPSEIDILESTFGLQMEPLESYLRRNLVA